MSMSKKDFIALADAIKAHQKKYDSELGDNLFDGYQLNTLADFCQSQNPNFMRERWLDYLAGKCGPNGGAK